jgi:phosphatidylglycerophosphate synthase
VARALHCQTPFGEVFDAIADGICYGFAMIVVTAYGWVPWPPVAIILTLGVINMVLRAIYARRAGRTTNYKSYAMERLVAFAAYLGGFATAHFLVDYFYWTFTVMMLLVVIHDAKRMAIDPVPAAPVAVEPDEETGVAPAQVAT